MTYPESELTPWFEGTQNPSRTGRYQVRLAGSPDIVEAWYESDRWRLQYKGMDEPLKLPRTQIEWRGLAHEPQRPQRVKQPLDMVIEINWGAP